MSWQTLVGLTLIWVVPPAAQHVLPISHQPRQNQAEGGTTKIKVNPSEVRQEMGHPACICLCHSGKASPVGDKPGVTRAVLTSIRVSNNPLVYLIDTPGIMVPNISDMHVGLKLALCCKR